jgi:hypothetical protein
MTDEQRKHIQGRFREAVQSQPELAALREILLRRGGTELVAPGKPDPDVPALIERGAVMSLPAMPRVMDASVCHENVSELWMDKEAGLSGIGTGYALSEDGLWRQHSWGLQQEQIIETTAARSIYFGVSLEGEAADRFAQVNQGDPRERYWRRLPVVWFRREQDEDGYPPQDWEGLKAEPTGEPDQYCIKSVPFFARDVGWEDEVRARKSDEDDSIEFEAVVKRSGYSVKRIWIGESEDRSAVVEYFIERDCVVEAKGRLVTIAIPRDRRDEVERYIEAETGRERWDHEDGYLADR